MTFKDALHIVSTDMMIPILVPEWFPNISKRLRNVRTAMAELRVRIILFSPSASLSLFHYEREVVEANLVLLSV